MAPEGKLMIAIGVALILMGALMVAGARLSRFGKLPGDIHVVRRNFSFHFPIVTCILLSILLTILLNLFFRNR